MTENYPTVGPLPEVDTQAMIEVDRLMIEDYGINLFQMMENAGRCLACLARDRLLSGRPQDKRIVVLAGSRGNGGGVLTAARRLASWGAKICVVTSQDPENVTEVPKAQLDILMRLENVTQLSAQDIDVPVDLILDGLIGYSLAGSPSGRAAALIEWANDNPAPILALDVPSGYDASSGVIRKPAIKAALTLTIALPKLGMQSGKASENIGDLYCADISVPPQLYRELPSMVEVGPIFAHRDILHIRTA